MTVAAALRTVEIVRFQPEIDRLRPLFAALWDGGRTQVQIETHDSYQGGAEWMVFWGPGAPVRARIMRHHIAQGGRAIALDLAYWQREQKFRVSIDAPHPQAWVMRRAWPRARFLADAPCVADAWSPTGPVVIAGIGRKAQAQYGADVVAAWEAEQAAICRARWPERRIILRPKPLVPTPIDEALQGVSLVITWHSNVAVDAIRFGIPVVCRDGAAAAVCPSEIPEEPSPLDPDTRDRFLGNLAWFQWAPSEARQFWAFLIELLA